MSLRSVVLGSGSALPKRSVSNEELAQQVDTSDAWIVERTGIRNRYVAGDGETTASLATEAARPIPFELFTLGVPIRMQMHSWCAHANRRI